MQPRKTELAHTALKAHRAPLDMRQRRALILCNGQRSLAELAPLLGNDTPALIAGLCAAGYLSVDAPQTAPTAISAVPDTSASAAAVTGTAARPAERRRSMAAARLYLLGILEMQRHASAAALFHELQQARDDAVTQQVLQQALVLLPQLTSAGYAARVRQRLLEVLPLTHTAALLDAMPPAGH